MADGWVTPGDVRAGYLDAEGGLLHTAAHRASDRWRSIDGRWMGWMHMWCDRMPRITLGGCMGAWVHGQWVDIWVRACLL